MPAKCAGDLGFWEGTFDRERKKSNTPWDGKKERRRSHFFLALRATQTVKVLQEIGPSLTEKVKE